MFRSKASGMPTDTLANVPDGSDVFVDANIFVYAFTAMFAECTEFLTRCARQEISALTSYDSIYEATHRLMVHEAFQKGLIPKPRAADYSNGPRSSERLQTTGRKSRKCSTEEYGLDRLASHDR